ncbi:hypothetical protein PMAC_003238 [Pneumocystis sp. 'macacae']|nr:hypothetical protein PMAC_003238 [Pneumocystis sp. 'macacae']
MFSFYSTAHRPPPPQTSDLYLYFSLGQGALYKVWGLGFLFPGWGLFMSESTNRDILCLLDLATSSTSCHLCLLDALANSGQAPEALTEPVHHYL